MIRITCTTPGRIAAVLILTICLGNTAAAEFLDGRDLELVNLFQGSPSSGFTVSFTVDSTAGVVEVPSWQGILSIDVFDTGPTTASVLITHSTIRSFGESPNLVHFTALSAGIPSFLNVVLGDASPTFDDPSRVSFNATTFSYDLGSLTAFSGDFVRLDLTAAPDIAGVPEPSSIAMLGGFGVTGMATFLLRRRRTAS